MRIVLAAGLVVGLAGGARAGEVPTEVSKLAGQTITLHVQPFLTDTELSTLRLVATNKQALKLFVTSAKGYAAIAVAPKEGFIRDGAPAASATAIGELPDAASAVAAALKGCDEKRKGGQACVIVLEVGPGR